MMWALDGATHAISQLTLPIPFPFAWLLSQLLSRTVPRFFFLITIRFQSVFGKHVKLYTPGANEAVAKNKEKARVSIAVWLGEEKSQQVSEC